MNEPLPDMIPLVEMVKVCNCAECGQEMLGNGQQRLTSIMNKAEKEQIPKVRVSGRIAGRPYCSSCLTVRRPVGGRSIRDDSPWQQNAVRALEEDR